MIAPHQRPSMMYEAFFNLRERPFDLVPNPKFLFLTGRQREALSNLRYGLLAPRGLTLLIGEAGTGKTTIIQAVLSELDPGLVECVLVSNPALTRAEFYESLAAGYRLGAEAGTSKSRFLTAFRDHLERRHSAGLLTALVVDEAQSMSHELLEEVRLLSNMETATTKLLNVVLTGQPELADRLNDPALRQLKQRVSLRCELAPLSVSETAAYIAGRIRIAGGDPGAIFSREAVGAVHDASRGVPRVINVICDNALIGAFASQTKPIVRALIDDICRDFDLNRGPRAFGAPAPAAPIALPQAEPARPVATGAAAPSETAPDAGPGGPRQTFF